MTSEKSGERAAASRNSPRTDHPYAMIDLFGTPYTKSLHVVERYRLRDYDDVRDDLKENWQAVGEVFTQHRGKFLQLHLTIEDEGVFKVPWTATLTYVPSRIEQLQEDVYPENPPILPAQECRGSNCVQAGFLKTAWRQLGVNGLNRSRGRSGAAPPRARITMSRMGASCLGMRGSQPSLKTGAAP